MSAPLAVRSDHLGHPAQLPVRQVEERAGRTPGGGAARRQPQDRLHRRGAGSVLRWRYDASLLLLYIYFLNLDLIPTIVSLCMTASVNNVSKMMERVCFFKK